jgi:ABC-type Fe3+/spermidine/putrescine transport system ATPase subunit
MALLEVKSVSKLFNADGKQMEALHDINLNIGENEFVCFIGSSGCGKTTLLRIIAGLEEPSSGEIRLEGLPIKGPGPEMGMSSRSTRYFHGELFWTMSHSAWS